MGSFVNTDIHGNGYFIGAESSCMTCQEPYIRSYNDSGQVEWFIKPGTGIAGTNSILINVSGDYSGNRYVLMRFQQLPYSLGNGIVAVDTFAIVKYNSVAQAVRITSLPSLYHQLCVDSAGSCFISDGLKVRRYNKHGNLAWEYVAGYTHKMSVDINNCTYIYNDSVAIKLNAAGLLKYTKVESGIKTVDPKGRLFVSTASGLKRYNRNGAFQWIRPAITGPVEVNYNGNVYEYRNDSIFKYNVAGNVNQWKIGDINFGRVMNRNGNYYVGGVYNAAYYNQGGWRDIDICPFQLPRVGSVQNISGNQVWVGLFNTTSPMPFQAAIYTGTVTTNYYLPNEVCTGDNLQMYFSYCTNSASSFLPNDTFSVEVSDLNGSFNNPVVVGDTLTAELPDTLTMGGNYRIRVVSTTPGVIHYPNQVNLNGNSAISVYTNTVSSSLSGSHSLCTGQTMPLSITTSDPTPYINWYNGYDQLPSVSGQNAITLDSSGSYFAAVTNYFCTTKYTDTLFLTVSPCPDYVLSPSGNTELSKIESPALPVAAGSTEQSLQLSPNPIVGDHFVRIKGLSEGRYSVKIYDVSGRLIKVLEFNKSEESDPEWSLSELNPGVYSMVVSGTKLSRTIKFVKMN